MYTHCPQCETVFRITAAQLKAHGGKVRCGRCQHVFQADRHLVEKPAKPTPKAAAAPRKRAPRKPPRGEAAAPTVAPTSEAAPATETPARSAPVDTTSAPPPRHRPASVRTRTIYWSIGVVLLVVLIVAQVIVFYGQDVARRAPFLHDTVARLCNLLPCQRLAPIDLRRLDLVETQVTPHPRYDRALRIKATIVNRADRAQPYPLLEVSLIDSQGHLVARRAYAPREYLRKPELIPEGLPPQVAVNVQLDITSPGPQASGFEVLLLPPSD